MKHIVENLQGGGYGYWLSPFYVNAFFFVSGYLFFSKRLALDNEALVSNLKKSYVNTFFRLLVPTILFSSLIYIPKMFFHSSDVSVSQFFYDVFGGVSFWFTSTIIVAQLLLLTLMLTRIKNIWFYFGTSVCLFVLALIIRNYDMTPFPWYYKSGMAATLFMTLGGIYNIHEKRIDGLIGKVGLFVLLLVYVVVMLLFAKTGDLRCAMLSVNVSVAGFAVSLLGISAVVGISKVLPRLSFLNYIGRHSIVFYFFSGAFPAAFGALALRLVGDWAGYWVVVVVCVLSLVCAYAVTWFIGRYMPFLLDLRTLKRS